MLSVMRPCMALRLIRLSRPLLTPKNAMLTRLSTPARSFSITPFRREGNTDQALSASIQEELKYEEESAAQAPAVPEFLSKFKSAGIWQISDKSGHDEVVLERTYGEEKLRVEFSVADLMDTPEEPEFDELGGEEGKANEGGEGSEEAYPQAYPIRVNVVITKSQSGAGLAIEAAVQDGAFVVEGASYFPDSKLATDSSADADWKRRTLYLGPQYDRLEVGLQERFDEYLQERGVGEELALFIPEYAEFKEQKEYMSWLRNVKAFVDA